MKATRKEFDFSTRFWSLLKREEYEKARALLEKELLTDPENHWLITQLGVTFYEQRKYDEALRYFRRSREILDDCPLTLWNLAGALDAVGKHSEAIEIYTSLLESKITADIDPCWESEAWSDRLKADCVYRLGVCFQNQRKKKSAKHCYRQYLDLLSIGVDGTYSSQEVVEKLRGLLPARSNGSRQLHKAVDSAIQSFALNIDAR
ncbi:MAG: tetratricopeptide repeat protein [Pirellulales bacterium]